MTVVHLGYFEDFKDDDTLLFAGDQAGLELLEKELRLLAEGYTDLVAVHSLPFVDSHRGVELVAYRSVYDSGVSGSKSKFIWERSKSGWNDTFEKIASLKNSEHGHHYLDAKNDELTIMVSKGEYSKEWWKVHG